MSDVNNKEKIGQALTTESEVKEYMSRISNSEQVYSM